MTTGEPHIPPTDHPYRRRIELRPATGVVGAAMEDYIHHFAVRLHHDGSTVTAVEVAPERTPWSSCAVGAAGLARLEGVALEDVADLDRWMGGRPSQCVHTTDLAVLAAAAARRGEERTYEVWLTGIGHRRRRATLLVDGSEWATWEIEAFAVLDEGRFAGLTLDRRSFSAWVAANLDADGAEAAFVLRRGSIIGMGRSLPMDEWRHPVEARPADDSCHTYCTDVAGVAVRNVGTARATEVDGPGAPIPAAHFGGVRRPDGTA